MMIYPSINDLMKNVDSRYALVIATAKRARAIADIQNEDPDAFELEGYDTKKPVALAVREIKDGKVQFFGKQNQEAKTALQHALEEAMQAKQEAQDNA